MRILIFNVAKSGEKTENLPGTDAQKSVPVLPKKVAQNRFESGTKLLKVTNCNQIFTKLCHFATFVPVLKSKVARQKPCICNGLRASVPLCHFFLLSNCE